ncbi:hypothetical protein [Streptomyces sp. KAU_LT]|uniref:hypothetical protein n=1 Tax=Streptomyces sp. KAU_LT TaxID=3046669 RepID=UPI0024B68619|nr:hypothetical protein [Streptomyces sp. KAU_LT]MDI9829673.1 hypothetical protein [Streptomyces sp. KAU_LT]
MDTTVTGTGDPGDPYEVSATVILDPAPPGGGSNLVHAGPDGLYTECADVRGCLSAGDGITYDSGTGVIAAEAAEPTALQAADTPTVDTTVTGTGSAGDPYEVSATVILDPAPPGGGSNLVHAGPDGLYTECADVRGCLSAGAGITYDSGTGEIAATGGTGEATALQAADTPTVDTTVTGDGSPGDPYEVSATVILDPTPPGGGSNLVHAGPDGLYTECADVRGCLSAGDGITYDTGTGVIAAEGTVVEAGTGVTVTGSGTTADPYEVSTVPLETGCGLTGDGSSTSPLAAVVAAWPYACDVDANAGGVYCDSAGQLRSEPRGSITFQQDQQVLDFADVAVPAPQDTEVATHTITVNNPDPCRPAFVIMEGEADADFVLPAGAGAALGIATDETWYLRNTGTTAMNDTHAQATKVVNGGTIAPGGSLNFVLSIRMGRGSGGATYNRVQSFLRAFIIVL